MKRLRPNQGMVVTVNGTSLLKSLMVTIISLVMIFLLTGILTSLKPEYRIASSSINGFANNIAGEAFVHLISMENHYFKSALPKESNPPKLSSLLFNVVTSVNPDDPRSLLGRELPGFSLFDSEILVAGEGTNYTTLPIESAPPMEVLENEREAAAKNLDDLTEPDKEKPKAPPSQTTGDRNVVYIYHTHNRESFFPMLNIENTSNANLAMHSEANITLVGEKLKKELEAQGVGAVVEDENFYNILAENKWSYSKSYAASRPIVESAMASNKDIQYIIDIHRDSQRYDTTTKKINGKAYAKVAFVIGGNYANNENNVKIANELHDKLEEKYPGLSRGIIVNKGSRTNGVFNQDLSENAMLIEFGGVDNSLEELNRTAAAVADVFSEHYWQAEKVNAEGETQKQ
ncbi:stage II sporulation protein P [Metabacillus arenae]|uniref:Stage II sporulation protein P n=1 Tax=Metabacillus arenae TaxID=2771434 RepID=A0A926S2K0_9BACI|nr:stage II sporulation protein P [Metabacillus arenae]MBD1382084.1 stage II sporulation protein P [Metabacillus arenae]